MSDLWKLPPGWIWTTMGDVTDVIGGGTPSTKNPLNFEGSIPWITPADMSGYSSKSISKGSRNISVDGFEDSGARWLPPGTVLFSSRAPIGYVAIASRYLTTNQGFKSFVPPPELNSDYLYYWLSSAKRYAESLASGTTFLEISGTKAALIPLPLAPSAEQTRIVAKLEELFSDLDAGVAELKAAQKKLTQYRQSLLKAAVDGSLTAEWRRQHQPAETGAQLLERILIERRERWEARQLAKYKEQGKPPPKDWQKKYPEPVQPDTGNLPELPEGWVWAGIDQTGDVQLGRQRAPQFHSGSNMVPYLRVANVFEERIDISHVMEMHFSEEDEATFKLVSGDVLLNEGQSLELVGRAAIFRDELPRACFTNTLVRFRAERGVLEEFALLIFLHYMHSGKFRKIAKITTNIAHLGAGRFAELEFPLPSTEEQAEVVRLLQTSMNGIHQQKAAIEISLKQAAAQRKNILKAAFSGQLVPQDPNDEPASVLLERIRAERAEQNPGQQLRGRKGRSPA